MQYFIKMLKYKLIRHKLCKENQFKYDEKKILENKPIIYLFFVACGTNMGDHAIVKAEKNFIYNTLGKNANIVDILVKDTESAIYFLKKNIRNQDIIILSGGGYIGDEYIEIYQPIKRMLKIFKKNKILIFPQTIFFKSKNRENQFIKLCKKCSNLKIFVREEKSKKIFSTYNIKAFCVPDIVLSEEIITHKKNGPILLCMRNDVEKYIDNSTILSAKKILNDLNLNFIETDTILENSFDLDLREQKLDEILNKFTNSSLVITDRIHGMIFSYLTQTPCIALNNYNHKVRCEYDWIKESNYINFLEDYSDDVFRNIVDKMLKIKAKEPVNLKDKFILLEKELKRIYE